MKFIFENDKTEIDLSFLNEKNELETKLRNGLKRKFFPFSTEKERLSELFYRADNLLVYQNIFLENFVKKHTNLTMVDAINHVRPGAWIKKHFAYPDWLRITSHREVIKFSFQIYSGLKIGVLVGTHFVFLNPNGKIECTIVDNLDTKAIYSEFYR